MNKQIQLGARLCALLLICAALFCCADPINAYAVNPPSAASATSPLLGDSDSGAVLYEQNADTVIEPASTTKVMTVLLVFEAIARGEISLDDKVMARQELIDGVMYDSSRVLPYIQNGEIMTVREYLYCILLMSDCVACDILGDYICGSLSDFIALMNSRAAELGCTNTHFVNTHGYPDQEHYTTARSLFLILREAVRYPEFCEIFGTIKYTLPATNMTEARNLYNSDWMLWNPEKITSIYCRYYYPYATGGKTGSSDRTGHCLVSTASKDGKNLVCVVTGTHAKNLENVGWTNLSYYETERLCEWGFNNHTSRTIVSAGDIVSEIAIENGDTDTVPLYASEDISILLPNDADISAVDIRPVSDGDVVTAPISKGDQLTEAVLVYNGTQIDTIRLYAACDVDKSGLLGVFHDEDEKKPRSILLLVAIALLVFVTAGMMLYMVKSSETQASVGEDDIIDVELARVMERSEMKNAPVSSNRGTSENEDE